MSTADDSAGEFLGLGLLMLALMAAPFVLLGAVAVIGLAVEFLLDLFSAAPVPPTEEPRPDA